MNDPAEWQNSPEYQAVILIAAEISVVHDFAERDIALIQNYGQILSRNEEQCQYLLQVVETHCQNHPQ